METLEYRTKDKTKWGDGPWQDEPDKKQWQDKATGLPCLIVRGPVGALCGYVGVAPGHPYYGIDYSEIDLDVHGGLTFSEACRDGDEGKSVCHVPGDGEPDNVWWFGFDCAHLYDLTPKLYADLRAIPDMPPPPRLYREESYRDFAYVTDQVEHLARQLKRVADESKQTGTA